ncbi:MAG: hypothetical protein AAGF95_02455 [Chloroflexota bacterium]
MHLHSRLSYLGLLITALAALIIVNIPSRYTAQTRAASTSVNNAAMPNTGANAQNMSQCSVIPDVPVSELQSVTYWEERFLDVWQYELDTAGPASQSGDSWKLYNLGYSIDANVAMLQATGKQEYLNRALYYVENVIDAAKPSSSLPGSSFQDAYLTWPNYSHPGKGNDGEEYPLFESYMWRYVTYLLRVIQANDELYDDPDIRARYDNILAFTETNIFDKWYDRGPEQYIYRQNTHMASHWARIAMDMAVLTTDSTQQSRSQEIVDNINHNLPNYPSGLRPQLQPNPLNPCALWWSDEWGQFEGPGQDVAHGNAVVGYMIESYENNIEWTNLDIQGLVTLLDGVVWPNENQYADTVDGSGQGSGWFNDGFVKLGRFHPDLQQRLEEHQVGQNTQLYGNLALNAKILIDGQPALADSTSAPVENPEEQQVTSFVLVNADTGADIRVLSDNDVVDLSLLGTSNISIRAETTPAMVGSVRFGLNDETVFHVENAVPYTIQGDYDGGQGYYAWQAAPGTYTLTATPFELSAPEGLSGTPLSMTFSVVAGND